MSPTTGLLGVLLAGFYKDVAPTALDCGRQLVGLRFGIKIEIRIKIESKKKTPVVAPV
jgi:hypothetical protein